MNTTKTTYRRKLPHIQPIGKCFFITFMLYKSIPQPVLRDIRRLYNDRIVEIENSNIGNDAKNLQKYELRKRLTLKYDGLLDNRQVGPKFLKDDRIADICKEQIQRFDGKYYDLLAYCIMSNHVHLLIDTQIQMTNLDSLSEYKNVDYILQRIKGASAKYANDALGRQGQFWTNESFDIYIRNQKMLGNVMRYIVNNPVKAGIVNFWKEFPHSYIKDPYTV